MEQDNATCVLDTRCTLQHAAPLLRCTYSSTTEKYTSLSHTNRIIIFCSTRKRTFSSTFRFLNPRRDAVGEPLTSLINTSRASPTDLTKTVHDLDVSLCPKQQLAELCYCEYQLLRSVVACSSKTCTFLMRDKHGAGA